MKNKLKKIISSNKDISKISLNKNFKKNININVDIKAIHNPLVIEARTKEIVTSAADNGLFTISTIVPIILLIIRDELEWEKLC